MIYNCNCEQNTANSFLIYVVILFIILNVIFCNIGLAATIKEPKVAADSAILMEAKTGRILWGKNIHKARPMASTTKIMTCILALEKGKLEDIVTTSSRASKAPRVKLYLQTGEKHTLGNLLYALMLVSANDVAVAVAEHISGSVESFCAEMTMKAKDIGAFNTVFETPNGLDSENHHSTAYDMAIITKYAMQNQLFVNIINTKAMNIQAVNNKYRNYSLVNHNRLLNEYLGTNGVKTGFTNGAGHCFVGAAKRNDMQLISVVLASGWGARGKLAKWTDTKALMNYGFDSFKYNKILKENTTVSKNVRVNKSKNGLINLYIKNSIELPIRDGEKENIIFQIYYPDNIEAPIKEGLEIGFAKIFIGDEYICEEPLYADRFVEENTIWINFKKILNSY